MTVNCILERVTETRSTNDDLLERWRAGELIDPVARIAHKQTAGKGRAGRKWLANPKDSICFSMAFPFNRSPAELTGLSLLVGIAVIDGIAKACQLDMFQLHQSGLRLKWPNDLLLNGAKLAGILIEGGQAKPGDPSWMIVGVGMNLSNANAVEQNLSQSGLKVGSLEQLLRPEAYLPDIEYLWLTLLESFEMHFKKFDQFGFASFQQDWMKWDAFANQKVCISGSGKETVYGIAKGVDTNGALLLEQADKTIAIYAGDVSLRIQS
ncbi:biotin--[acetyl-CoA-carboxylase] ligase [Polynucleobacter wuianus]|uniref:biotin--[biotin carboxyl-carrier protein] ligase n=1 Tax=Polynucleobacter wuianus TaxID=1743168 RepID=A0A191UHS4_9BURK|nr:MULTISPECIES: biotin--[acetyl-CoA-carboxylase] ligase [Polynucleobacter]ANJ00548.1 biotin--[acetyl-CoA-carboxylase] ligase [Polynucleobacter wuianus]MBU3553140.1 biotin--[acetyl-CoA-carboxylase] ligase [Polynucleobacter sp. MWH-Post4-6-1]